MRTVLCALFLLVSFSANAFDVLYGINDLGHTVGQRWYCKNSLGDVPCGILNDQIGTHEIAVTRGSAILDVNNSGQMVGYITPIAAIVAARCSINGCGAIPAAYLGFPTWSDAWRINDAGQILIVKAKYNTRTRKTVYSECILTGSICTELMKLSGEPQLNNPEYSGANLSATYSYALNNLGHTGGVWYNTDQSEGYGFILANGVQTYIAYPGAVITTVYGLNDIGEASGSACLATDRINWVAGATCTAMIGFKWRNGVFESFPNPLYDMNVFGTATRE